MSVIDEAFDLITQEGQRAQLILQQVQAKLGFEAYKDLADRVRTYQRGERTVHIAIHGEKLCGHAGQGIANVEANAIWFPITVSGKMWDHRFRQRYKHSCCDAWWAALHARIYDDWSSRVYSR